MATKEAKDAPRGCKTDDLLIIHNVFRQGFSRAPGLVEKANPVDSARVRFVAHHLGELLQALHNHHNHEDILWWDRLKHRAAESAADVDRMIRAHEEVALDIVRLQDQLKTWEKNPRDKRELLAGLSQLNDALFAHLADEERTIMPLAARVLSQTEWDEAHTIGMKETPRNRLMVQLGYLIHCAPTPQLRRDLMAGLLGFVKLLYRLGGKKKFEKEWLELYGSMD